MLLTFLWVRALKKKTGDSVVSAFKHILAQGRSPQKIRSDLGGEFIGTKFQRFLKEKGIHYFSANNETKANYAERVIRTLRGKLFKYMNKKQSYQYITVLQDIVESYNNTYHRSIKTFPAAVNKQNENEIWFRLYGNSILKRGKYVFKPGDLVRVAYTRKLFDRGYQQQFSDEIFTVEKQIPRNPPVYKIKDLNGEIIMGTFYKEELQHVFKDENSEYQIEKIVKKRKRDGKTQYLVRWLGYGPEFDSYVNEEDVRHLQ